MDIRKRKKDKNKSDKNKSDENNSNKEIDKKNKSFNKLMKAVEYDLDRARIDSDGELEFPEDFVMSIFDRVKALGWVLVGLALWNYFKLKEPFLLIISNQINFGFISISIFLIIIQMVFVIPSEKLANFISHFSFITTIISYILMVWTMSYIYTIGVAWLIVTFELLALLKFLSIITP